MSVVLVLLGLLGYLSAGSDYQSINQETTENNMAMPH